MPGIPDDLLIAATVDVPLRRPGELKTITLLHIAAAEAIADRALRLNDVDRDRFACAISGHMGDTGFVDEQLGLDQMLVPAGCPLVAAVDAQHRLLVGGQSLWIERPADLPLHGLRQRA